MYQTITTMLSALRWLFILPVFIFFLVFVKTPVFAADNAIQTTNPNLAPVTNPNVPQNLHTYTQSVFIELLATGFCQLTGYDPLSSAHKCLGIDPNTHRIGFTGSGDGLIGLTGNMISMTYSMPSSSVGYVKYLAQNFGLAKKAYADNPCSAANNSLNGVGFCSIQVLTNIWVSMRDIVYLLFTVIFIVIGLAIMLRVNIDPRTVMTVENQIPKIIIGILMVTFSFAIAGFLIDIMYVAIYLVGNVLVNIPNSGLDHGTYNTIATSGSPLDAAGNFSTDVVGSVATGIANMITQNVTTIFSIPIIGDVGKGILWLILYLIFLLAFWITLLRVWVSLIIAYVMILLDVIFAPFWFLAGLLPGGSLGVGAWFRDIFSNIAVFPTTIAMFALAIVFSNIGSGTGGYLFNPPMVGHSDASTLGSLIVFGFVFMTPQALTIVKAAIKAPKFNFGPVFAPAGAAVSVIRSSAAAGATYGKSTKDEMEERGFRRVLRRVVS